MSDKIKEWDEYFSVHCTLPASAIRDLFEYIVELEVQLAESARRARRTEENGDG